jgi:hypothetical protein
MRLQVSSLLPQKLLKLGFKNFSVSPLSALLLRGQRPHNKVPFATKRLSATQLGTRCELGLELKILFNSPLPLVPSAIEKMLLH